MCAANVLRRRAMGGGRCTPSFPQYMLPAHRQSLTGIHLERLAVPALRRTFAVEQKARPFEVLGIQQVAIGGLRKEALGRLWVDTLGVEKVGSHESEAENVSEDILRIGKGASAVEVDLMQPLDPDKSPKVHVPALNHVGLWVHPLPACVDWLKKQGMRFTPGGIRKGAGGHDVAFIHPKANADHPLSGEGVLIELVQATPQVIEEAKKQ